MSLRPILAAAVATVCAACGSAEVGRGPLVSAVPSGDTIRLVGGRTIRLLGIDAPNGRECHAYLSRRALADLAAPGTRVRLSSVSGGAAVVFRGDLNVNLELVRLGAASAYLSSTPGVLRRRIVDSARRARASRVGAWGGCYGTLDPSRNWRLERRAPDRIFR